MADTPTAAGIYSRLSYAPDGSLEKVERQETDCRALGDRLAWPISEPHVLSDNNRSAWQRNRKRPGWDRLLAAIETGEIDAVIVYHGDRLIRQPYDLEKLINVADAKGIHLASVTGTRNLDNPDDRYILRIEAAGFCRASDDSSRRVKRALEARKEAGLPRAGGTRAFGFERDNITIRGEEADVIREAAERLLAGQSNYGVMQWANGVSTTSTDRRWRANVLRDLLLRPRVAGLLLHDGQLVKAPWEPIIEPDMWLDLKALLESRKTTYLERANAYKPTGASEYAVRYLLTGIARCGTCDGSMMVQSQRTKQGKPRRRSYLCANDGCELRCSCSVGNLDSYVIGRVLAALNDQEFVATLYADRDDPGLAGRIADLERRKAKARDQLENLADEEEIDPVLVARSLASFDRKITALREQRASTARRRLLARMAGIDRPGWDAEPLDVRRAAVAALFRVTVSRATRFGSGFDPSRVALVPVADADQRGGLVS